MQYLNVGLTLVLGWSESVAEWQSTSTMSCKKIKAESQVVCCFKNDIILCFNYEFKVNEEFQKIEKTNSSFSFIFQKRFILCCMLIQYRIALIFKSSMVKIVDNYTLTQYLGKGEYGKVYKAFHIDTKIDVAIKMIPLDKFIELSKLTELTKNQIETLRSLEDNINVVNFVEMIKSNHYIYLVYEFCEGGTLEDLLRDKGPLPQKEALVIFRQLINAFRSLHDHHILHRDIKPNNIFFKSGHLKLADFGFCKKLRSADDFTHTSLGSPLYMAPQILNGDVYGSKADVWSCGIVLFEMLFGYCPYGHCNIKEMLEIYNGERGGVKIPSDKFPISPVTEMMLSRMLEKDQFRRISWEDFLYEYEITPQGILNKKEKDFQYDLMKLMKKNSYLTNPIKKQPPALKFDWSKITETDSSVHSEELSPMVGEEDTKGLDDLLKVKRKIKDFENQHKKLVQITLLLETILDTPKDFQYSNTVIYFLSQTLSFIVTSTLKKIEEFAAYHQQFLGRSEHEANEVHKLEVVFKNQAESIVTRTNSIKVTLLQCPTLNKEVFKFPHKPALRKYLKQYIDNYELNSKGVTGLTPQGSKEDTILLLRIVWAVSQTSVDQQGKKPKEVDDLLSIKPEMSKFQLSVQLNKYLVALGL